MVPVITLEYKYQIANASPSQLYTSKGPFGSLIRSFQKILNVPLPNKHRDKSLRDNLSVSKNAMSQGKLLILTSVYSTNVSIEFLLDTLSKYQK